MSSSTRVTTPTAPVALAVGDEMPASEFGPLTRSHIVRYAGAGGDFNPIHHDEEFARSAGMPGVFGMGLLHGGLLGQRLAAYVVLRPGSSLDEDGVREIVRAGAARFAVPRDVVFLEELPRNQTGKVVSRELPGVS